MPRLHPGLHNLKQALTDVPGLHNVHPDPVPINLSFVKPMVPQEGLEPPTPSLRMRCSTN
jgi:hypothetical protein